MKDEKEAAHKVQAQEQIKDNSISKITLKIGFDKNELEKRMSHILLLSQELQKEVNSLTETIKIEND